jgi:hypothetical protein
MSQASTDNSQFLLPPPPAGHFYSTDAVIAAVNRDMARKRANAHVVAQLGRQSSDDAWRETVAKVTGKAETQTQSGTTDHMWREIAAKTKTTAAFDGGRR